MKSVCLLLNIIFISAGAFAVKANSAQANMLSQYYWEHRVLITSIGSEAELATLEKQLNDIWPELEERKLIIFAMGNKKVYQLSPEVVTSKQNLEELTLRLNKHHTVLIGLDGGSKRVYDTFDDKLIFADIDAMPMRRVSANNED